MGGAVPDEGGEASKLLLIFSIFNYSNIKVFRAVTARSTFLGLCKETWRNESTPRLRARFVAPGSRSRLDFPRGHPALAENSAHPCAAPFGSCPPPPPLRRGPESQSQRQRQRQRQRRKPGRAGGLIRRPGWLDQSSVCTARVSRSTSSAEWLT